MEQFKNGKVSIDIPNATVIFPKGFDSQIARVCNFDSEESDFVYFILFNINLGLHSLDWGPCDSIFMCSHQYGPHRFYSVHGSVD